MPEITPEDRRLAAAALEKRRRGQEPTKEEKRALARFESHVEEEQRRKFYATCPKGHYTELAGRQVKVVNEQAARYGVPCGGKVVDLGAVVRFFHDFLARNKTLLAGSTDDPLFDGASQRLKNEYVKQQIAEKREKARLAQLERLAREGRLLDATAVHQLTSRLSGILRGKCEALQRFDSIRGRDAVKIIADGLDDMDAEIERYFADYHGVGQSHS